MSDRRHGTRATLPEGYQFGDAAKCRFDKVYGAMCSTCWSEMVYRPDLHAWCCTTCTARILLPWTADCFKETGWRVGDTVTISFDWYRCPKCAHTWRLASNHPALPNCPQPSCRFPLTSWRAPHENAAAQLKERHAHNYTSYDPARDAYLCVCGASIDAVGVWSSQRTGDETV
jgi:hypothetical protein